MLSNFAGEGALFYNFFLFNKILVTSIDLTSAWNLNCIFFQIHCKIADNVDNDNDDEPTFDFGIIITYQKQYLYFIFS